jgi:hypothetical protein
LPEATTAASQDKAVDLDFSDLDDLDAFKIRKSGKAV